MKSILLTFVVVFALAQGNCGDSPNAEPLEALPVTTPTPTPTPEPKRTTLHLPTGESVVEIRHHDGRIEYQELEGK